MSLGVLLFDCDGGYQNWINSSGYWSVADPARSKLGIALTEFGISFSTEWVIDY